MSSRKKVNNNKGNNIKGAKSAKNAKNEKKEKNTKNNNKNIEKKKESNNNIKKEKNTIKIDENEENINLKQEYELSETSQKTQKSSKSAKSAKNQTNSNNSTSNSTNSNKISNSTSNTENNIDSPEMDLEDETAERLNKLPVEELEVPKEAPMKDVRIIEFSNPLSRPIDDKVQRMTPLEMFMFIIDDFAREVAKLSRNYALRELNDHSAKITREDIELYIFLFIYLSVYQIPEIDMLWEENRCFSNIMPKLISRAGFKKINQCLCIFRESGYGINAAIRGTKTEKISETVEYFNNKWQALFPPTKFLTIDEAMSSSKGTLTMNQGNQRTRNDDIKFFAKASADKGYLYRLIPFSESGFHYNETVGIGATIVKELAEGHQNKGFHFTLDSYYANLYSFKYLYDNGIGFTGTFIRERRALPEKIRNTVLRPGGEVLYQIKNTSIKMYMFYAVKQIQIASSAYSAEKVKYINASNCLKYKPEMIAYYNLTKAGVDLSDCATQIYKSQRGELSWWRQIFFYLIDVSMNNCKICYLSSTKFRERIQRNGALFFRRVLINQFIEYFHPPLESDFGFSGNVLPPAHFPVPFPGTAKCAHCLNIHGNKGKKNSAKNCRNNMNVENTRFRCSICCVPLCKECFSVFHINGEYEKILNIRNMNMIGMPPNMMNSNMCNNRQLMPNNNNMPPIPQRPMIQTPLNNINNINNNNNIPVRFIPKTPQGNPNMCNIPFNPNRTPSNTIYNNNNIQFNRQQNFTPNIPPNMRPNMSQNFTPNIPNIPRNFTPINANIPPNLPRNFPQNFNQNFPVNINQNRPKTPISGFVPEIQENFLRTPQRKVENNIY